MIFKKINPLLLQKKDYKKDNPVSNLNINLNNNYDIFDNEIYNINLLLSNLRSSSFKLFFKNLEVDTPESLNVIKSLKRLKSTTLLKRLASYFLKSGKRNKTLNQILISFNKIIFLSQQNYSMPTFLNDWRFIHFILSFSASNKTKFSDFPSLANYEMSSNFSIKNNFLLKPNLLTIDSILRAKLKKFNVLFSFYIYKVDKQIYKNSRGKSGKYTFIWKYVAPYKRYSLIFHWLSKEIKVTNGKNLQERLHQVLKNFIFETKKTWIWKIQLFSLNYVYFNLRRTLGETYLTSTR